MLARMLLPRHTNHSADALGSDTCTVCLPACADFVRWHSPKDCCQEADGGGGWELSGRMAAQVGLPACLLL